MDEEIVSLKFVADDASVLDSVERVGEKITDLSKKSKSLFNTGEGQPSQMAFLLMDSRGMRFAQN